MQPINLMQSSFKEPENYFWSRTVWFMTLFLSLLVFLLFVRTVLITSKNSLEKRVVLLEKQLTLSALKFDKIQNWQKEKNSYEKKIVVLQSLLRENLKIRNFFHELIKIALKNGYFTEIEKKGDFLKIKGITKQPREVAALCSKIEKSDYFQKAQIVSIKADEKYKTGSSAACGFVIEAKIKDKK